MQPVRAADRQLLTTKMAVVVRTVHLCPSYIAPRVLSLAPRSASLTSPSQGHMLGLAGEKPVVLPIRPSIETS